MSGRFTRKIYDDCSLKQDTRQSTDPLSLILDPTKFVNHNNICRPDGGYNNNSVPKVDIESSLMGIDRTASRCDTAKYPLCGPEGCLLNSEIPPHITPYACDRGSCPQNSVISSNMRMPRSSGIPQVPSSPPSSNGYYSLPPDNMTSGYYAPSNSACSPHSQTSGHAPVGTDSSAYLLRSPVDSASPKYYIPRSPVDTNLSASPKSYQPRSPIFKRWNQRNQGSQVFQGPPGYQGPQGHQGYPISNGSIPSPSHIQTPLESKLYEGGQDVKSFFGKVVQSVRNAFSPNSSFNTRPVY